MFRITLRGFWKGVVPVSAVAPRLGASPVVFNGRGRRPWASVNVITAHDGFTLGDLVSYNDKHNEANGEENRDGTSDNQSWNCGAEGPSADPAVVTLRASQMRGLLVTLLLSQGVPMLLAGDEFARSQEGNNNAYCQDNAISWINWDISPEGEALQRFVRRLTALRREYPMLRGTQFLTGALNRRRKVKDVTWISPAGTEMTPEDWGRPEARVLGMLLADTRRRVSTSDPTDARLLLVFNGHHEPAAIVLPDSGGPAWRLLLDTTADDAAPDACPAGGHDTVPPRAVRLFTTEDV
jgi:glycogen operon protein